MEYKNKLADTPEGVYMTKVLSKTALWSICKHNSKKWGLSPFSKKWGLSPFSRAFIVLLASKEPKNLTNGAKVDCGEALSTFNRKEYHHIFPQAFLEKQGAWSNSDINSLCNFCILPASSNKLISDKAPSQYFSEDVPTQHLREILETNLLPANKKLYDENKYSEFLNLRSQEIVAYLDSLII